TRWVGRGGGGRRGGGGGERGQLIVDAGLGRQKIQRRRIVQLARGAFERPGARLQQRVPRLSHLLRTHGGLLAIDEVAIVTHPPAVQLEQSSGGGAQRRR